MDTTDGTWLDFYYELRFAHLRTLYAEGGTIPPVPIPTDTRGLSDDERAALDRLLSRDTPPRRPPVRMLPKGTALFHIAPRDDGKLPADRPIWMTLNVADLDILWAYFESEGIAEARRAFEYELQEDVQLLQLDAEYSFTDLERYLQSLDRTYVPTFGFDGRGDNHVAAQWLRARAGKPPAPQGGGAQAESELAHASGWTDFLSFPVRCVVQETMLTAPGVVRLRRALGGRKTGSQEPTP